jgi:hypothetical protein
MSYVTKRPLVSEAFDHYKKMHPTEAETTLKPGDEKFLNLRWAGYNARDVAAHWIALREDADARAAERRFLVADLIFPVFYGGALAAGLVAVWSASGRPFAVIWLLLPVLLGVFADWTENLMQLAQLKRYASSGSDGLQSGWIQVASAATVSKLFTLGLSFFALFVMAVIMARSKKPQP